ncbi:E3 ubiquitin-protein ligase TTC3 isoform X2 [Aquarana catesbeiana]|uniref:E3 ubiquitin-protein ligase TTC3 isoform X2 n=1 Tax=Aquarana catesbeiana TaxID=8400 RepID=UPI003CC9BAAF
MEHKRRKTLYKQVELENGRIVGISDADLSDIEKEHLLAMSDVARDNLRPLNIPPDIPYNMRTTLLPPQCPRGHHRKPVEPFIDIVRKVEPVAFWFSHSIADRIENCELMKMYMLWPVFMHASNNTTTCLRTREPHSVEMTIKELNFIELLEDLAELFKKVSDQRSLVEEAFKIGWQMEKEKYKVKNRYIADAMSWIESTGDETLYKKLKSQEKSQEKVRNRVLQTFFTEYAFFFIKMAEDHRKLSEEVKMQMCELCEMESEEHRAIGKSEFEKEQYDMAEFAYTTAIYFSPESYVLFSNRALCYIRMQIYGKALTDGKKAIILKNIWPKGHYRFCEALFALGEIERAIASNEKAQELCRDSQEGIKDLIQQHSKFKKLMKETAELAVKKSKKLTSDKNSTQPATDKESKGIQTTALEETPPKSDAISRHLSVGSCEGLGLCVCGCPSVLKSCPMRCQQKGLEETNNASVGTEDGSETASVPQQKKGKSKGKNCESSEKLNTVNTKNDSKEGQKVVSPYHTQLDLTLVMDMVKSLVRDAQEALSDLRCHSAEGMLSQVLEILSQYDIQSLRLTKIDHVVLIYGHANALLGIRKCVELARAEKRFKEIIQHHSKERFNCLAFYGIGNVYLKQNRFSDALSQYVRSKTMLMHKMVPGVLAWPTTSIVIEETRPEKLEILLDTCIEECKFPPKPNAVCRFEQCLGLPKIQIYFTDPDFKGFIRLVCCQYCIVEFHVCCWKKLKATAYSDKNDKDFLRYPCLTPDCRGLICHIVIYDTTGEVKCEFEDKIVKKKEPHKPAVKHKGTSAKKHKAKHENKAERKKILEEEHVDQPCSGNRGKRQEKILPDAVVSNGFHIPWDPLLSQVIQKQQLIIRGCPLSFPKFWDSIAAWRIISVQELSEFDKNTSLLPQSNSKMKNLLNHLYKLNDRVKTRVLLYLLKVHHEHISSDLHKWILMIDEKGLQAAEGFRVRNEEHLKSIKLQDVINLWNVSYGKNIDYELTDSLSNSLYDTLFNMSIQDFRCFVWFLAENRNIESVSALGKELDKYFQEMDVPSGKVPAYSLEELSNKVLKNKPKHRKKKQNQPKPIYKLSGAVSTRSQEDDIFSEENTLSLLDPNEPFLIPEFLRRDIDEFQGFFDPGMFVNRYPVQFDDPMDPVRLTLYEYFSQILEEHGPLNLDDEILIGEYKNFPEETKRMVEASGGLKDFLLESLLFSMEGDMVTLTGYDIPYLEHGGGGYQLNPTADEFTPSFSRPVPDNIDLYSDPSQPEPKYSSSGSADTSRPSIPHSDITFNYAEYSDIHNNFDQRTLDSPDNPTSDIDQDSDDDTDESSTSSSDSESSSSIDQDITVSETTSLSQENLHMGELDSNISQSFDSKSQPRNKRTAIVSVQVNIEMSHCEVNTDAFQPFESQQGDILRMEKEQTALIEQLKEATEKYESLKSRFQEEIVSLEAEIKMTVEYSKIAKLDLNALQQDQENKAKKWHQEKKENQEKIKALKNNIKMTTDASDRCSRSIEEKKKQYEAYIKDFAKIHYSKFDKEKATLEKHVKKCEEEWEETRQRAIAAEVIVLENRKQCELLKIRIRVATVDRNISMFNPVVLSNPAPQIIQQLREMQTLKLKLKKEMEMLEAQFDEKINSAKSGLKLNNLSETPVASLQSPPSDHEPQIQSPPDQTRVSSSPPSGLVCAKPANPVPAKSPGKKGAASKKVQAKELKKAPPCPAVDTKSKNQPPAASSNQGIAGQDRKSHAQPEPTLPSPAKPTLFDKIIHELHDIFPHYKNAELTAFIKDFRVRNNGTLSGLTHEDIISRVTEYILDIQVRNPASTSATSTVFKAGAAMPQTLSPQAKQPWKVVNLGNKNKWQNDLESFNEDPCIICHDELKQNPVHKLDCGHYFHKHCIKTWLNTQSTCPTCREHALLPEDFPVLCGRMRTV